MARYALPAPMSMYRDTGLVANTELFRRRYVENMAADDQIAQSVLNMVSMEQDNEAKRALIDKYNTQLEQRASSGNYHLLGSTIHKDARNFVKDYRPIQLSKAKYDAWLEGLTKQRDAFIKTGKGVDPATYNAKIAEANYNYKGLKYNADGSVDDSSLFNGPQYVGYVDVEAEIIKNMKDVVMTEIDTTGMEFALDAGGNEISIERGEAGDPAYYMKYGTYTKKLDEKLVSSVVTDVLNKPHVAAYIQQNAHLENYTKGEVDPNTNESIATQEVNGILQKLDGQINKLEAKKKLTKEEQNMLQTLLNTEEAIEDAREDNVSDLNILTSSSFNAKRQNYLDSAIRKYAGVKSFKQVRDYSESSRYTQRLKENPISTIKYRVGPEGLTTEVMGGLTVNEKQEMFNNSTEVLKGFTNTYGQDFVDAAFNAGNSDDYRDLVKLAGGRISQERAKQISAQIKDHKQTQELITVQLNEAFMSEFKMSPEQYGNIMENEASMLSGSFDDVNYVDGQFNINMRTIQDAFAKEGKTGLSNGQMIKMLSEDKQFRNKIINIIGESFYNNVDKDAIGSDVLRVPELVKEIKDDFIDETADVLNDMVDTHISKVTKDQKKISDFLDPDKSIATDAIILPSFDDPTGKTTTQIKDLFSEALPPMFQLQDKNGNPSTYQQLLESDEGFWKNAEDNPPTIVKDQVGLVHVATPDGKSLIAIPFKNKDGETEMFYAPSDQIQSDAINQYVGSQMYKLRSIYRKGIWANVQTWTPEIFEGTVTFDYSNPNDEKITVNGITMGVEEGLKAILLYMEDNNSEL